MISNQEKLNKFQFEEAVWIDSMVEPLLPRWLSNGVKKRSGTFIGRILHFAVDYFLIGKYLRIRVERQRHMEITGGQKKGFRPGPSQQIIRKITTRISKRGAPLGEKDFVVNIII